MMGMSLVKLERRADAYICPKCGRPLRERAGGSVRIVNGRVDMDATKKKYICDHCNVYYQEVLQTGYFDKFPLPVELRSLETVKKKPLKHTGDLQPMVLRREADGKCACPRCGERMDFVGGQPVSIVDGHLDMEDVMDHFHCPYCGSVFRRIASTDYFQWSEK